MVYNIDIMVKVDLITGFLGAGKTTFLQKYIPYLKSKGEKIHIIENEFAERGIDSELLHAEQDSCCKISDLSGMCMCCIGKKEFIRLLLDAAVTGIDRIVVEPSGIYDVDEFFDVLSDARVSQFCEIGCIITIVDPTSHKQLTEEAKYLTFAQLVASGTVVYSKTQLISNETLAEAQAFIDTLLREKGCENGLLGDVCIKPWDELSDSDFEDMEDSAYYRLVHDRETFEHSSIFQSEEIHLRDCENENDIRQRIQALFDDTELGKIFRIKGFVKSTNGQNFEVNCTGQYISIEKTNVNSDSLVVIGQKLKITRLYL